MSKFAEFNTSSPPSTNSRIRARVKTPLRARGDNCLSKVRLYLARRDERIKAGLGASLLAEDQEVPEITDVEVSEGDHRKDGKDAAKPTAPWQWIYRNLTPWRIHACFTAKGTLLPSELADEGAAAHDGRVVRVLSIPALGEVTLPDEDARRLNTLPMRRLGQIEVRPAPSELWGSLPQAVMIFGWLVVGLVFGAWALFFGGGSALPWAWVVAAVVAVPVVALLVATVREFVLHRRFNQYRKAQEPSTNARGAAGRQSLEGVEGGSRIRTFVDGVPRHAAEVTVLIGAVVVSVIGLGVAIHLTSELKELLPIDYGALAEDLDRPARGWLLIVLDRSPHKARCWNQPLTAPRRSARHSA